MLCANTGRTSSHESDPAVRWAPSTILPNSITSSANLKEIPGNKWHSFTVNVQVKRGHPPVTIVIERDKSNHNHSAGVLNVLQSQVLAKSIDAIKQCLLRCVSLSYIFGPTYSIDLDLSTASLTQQQNNRWCTLETASLKPMGSDLPCTSNHSSLLGIKVPLTTNSNQQRSRVATMGTNELPSDAAAAFCDRESVEDCDRLQSALHFASLCAPSCRAISSVTIQKVNHRPICDKRATVVQAGDSLQKHGWGGLVFPGTELSWDPWVVLVPSRKIRRVYFLFQKTDDSPPGKQFW